MVLNYFCRLTSSYFLNYKMKFYLLVFLSFLAAQDDCVDGRYVDSLFDVEISYSIEYGENMNEPFLFGDDYLQTLYMDIYQPAGDQIEDRPLIIFMFGGAFIGGSRDSGAASEWPIYVEGFQRTGRIGTTLAR